MSREQKYTAIILKKQPYGESDEIITFYTKENGKVRGLAKSVKSAKSKLQQRLQSLFLVEVALAGNKLPKVISADPKYVFMGLRENLDALKRAFYGVEVVLKFTPDEEKNTPLFELLEDFLKSLDAENSDHILDLKLLKFKLALLSILGLSFSYSNEAEKLIPELRKSLTSLQNTDFEELAGLEFKPRLLKDLQELLSQFIEYQLERKVKSEKYLRSNMV